MGGIGRTGGFIRKGLEVRRSFYNCRDEKKMQ